MNSILRSKKAIAAITALAVIAALFWYYQPAITVYYTIASIALVGLLLYVGNWFITKTLDRWFPWITFGRKRFFSHLLIGILFSIGVINAAYYIVKALATDLLPTTEQLVVANVYGAIVIIPVFSIYFSLHFLNHWQQSELEMERFQKESMSSQLETLKNHLDPHFLFNNLNILSALIDKDKEQSQEFLGRFAQVYRTMLLTKAEDLITLEEEMNFIETYIYLIRTRFQDFIQFRIELDQDDSLMYMMPPLTLQMLIENAVKHNNITAEKPLVIRIYRKKCRLFVENNINEKPEDLKTKSGTGLKNIQARYKYYTDEEVLINRVGEVFRASLPLIEIEEI
ncbi:sensor histidine kinase [Marinoscillum sp.]|uniref:sensor histidine kinase n=1 Tax=Marinoscillum sp. TaxID=2024838 RepID=UPI003BA87CDA